MDEVCQVCKRSVPRCMSGAAHSPGGGDCPGCRHNQQVCPWEDLLTRAKDTIKATRTTHLQSALKISYSTQVRILDQLEREGLIGPLNGAKPREIYM